MSNATGKLFGSKTRVKLLDFFYNHPDQSFIAAEIKSVTNINPKMLSSELTNLNSIGIIQKSHRNKHTVFSLNEDSQFHKALSLLFKKTQWTQWERPAKIHHLVLTLEASLTPMLDYYGYNLSPAHLMFNHDTVTWFFKMNNFIETGKNLIPIYKKRKKEIWDDFYKFANKIPTTSNSYKHFYNNYINFWKVAYIAEPISFYIDSLLKPNEQIGISKKSFTDEYEDDLWKLTEQARTKGIKSISTSDFIEKYHWIRNSYHGVYHLSNEDVIKEVKARLHKDRQAPKEVSDPTSISKELIEIGKDMIYMQDLRKKYMMQATHYLYELLESVGKENDIKLSDMELTVPKEILNIKAELPSLIDKLIKRRKACTITATTRDGIKIYDGQSFPPKEFSQTIKSTLDGRVACGGKVVGKVRILEKPGDIAKVNHGDIIVSPMTTPDFMPAIRRAVGIVTDFGGITCHAAIISREFNIPCIVGTETATKTLKDGDLVEVDADKGMIRILNR